MLAYDPGTNEFKEAGVSIQRSCLPQHGGGVYPAVYNVKQHVNGKGVVGVGGGRRGHISPPSVEEEDPFPSVIHFSSLPVS